MADRPASQLTSVSCIERRARKLSGVGGGMAMAVLSTLVDNYVDSSLSQVPVVLRRQIRGPLREPRTPDQVSPRSGAGSLPNSTANSPLTAPLSTVNLMYHR